MIPRAQLKEIKPRLARIFATDGDRGIARAYREHGYRPHKIAAHLGVRYATASRRVERLEPQKLIVGMQDPTLAPLFGLWGYRRHRLWLEEL